MMQPRVRRFILGFTAGLALFVVLGLAAAHFQSDCGLGAWLGTVTCADDIRRAGFPWIVTEQGGFAGRSTFAAGALLLDLLVAGTLGLLAGLVSARLGQRAGR